MRNAQTFLRMKTRPLRRGDVLFAYGNAAARTFGRAHRRRPYHFSCGSMFQGCWRTVRRWTNTRNACRRIVRRRTKSKKGCWRTVRRWTKSKKGCWRTVRRRYSALFIAGKQFAADILRCLSQENSSPLIFCVVYRRKTVRRRYSTLFIAGKGARRCTEMKR